MNPQDEASLESARELDLATTGRKSGAPKSVELWHVYEQGCVYLLAGLDASGISTHWYRNLKANPQATLHVKGKRFPALSEPVDDDKALSSHIMELFRDKYGLVIMRQWYEGNEHVSVKLKVVA